MQIFAMTSHTPAEKPSNRSMLKAYSVWSTPILFERSIASIIRWALQVWYHEVLLGLKCWKSVRLIKYG
jgi:hypothetical protein